MPISWYDWSGRLIRQSVTDANGFYEVMLPSTNRINYPSPAGVSPGSYTLVANDPSMADPTLVADPGVADLNPRPVVPNPDFDPQYRSITDPVRDVGGPHDDHRPRGLDHRRRRERPGSAALASREVPARRQRDPAAVRRQPRLRDPAVERRNMDARPTARSRSPAPASVPARPSPSSTRTRSSTASETPSRRPRRPTGCGRRTRSRSPSPRPPCRARTRSTSPTTRAGSARSTC